MLNIFEDYTEGGVTRKGISYPNTKAAVSLFWAADNMLAPMMIAQGGKNYVAASIVAACTCDNSAVAMAYRSAEGVRYQRAHYCLVDHALVETLLAATEYHPQDKAELIFALAAELEPLAVDSTPKPLIPATLAIAARRKHKVRLDYPYYK